MVAAAVEKISVVPPAEGQSSWGRAFGHPTLCLGVDVGKPGACDGRRSHLPGLLGTQKRNMLHEATDKVPVAPVAMAASRHAVNTTIVDLQNRERRENSKERTNIASVIVDVVSPSHESNSEIEIRQVTSESRWKEHACFWTKLPQEL